MDEGLRSIGAATVPVFVWLFSGFQYTSKYLHVDVDIFYPVAQGPQTLPC